MKPYTNNMAAPLKQVFNSLRRAVLLQQPTIHGHYNPLCRFKQNFSETGQRFNRSNKYKSQPSFKPNASNRRNLFASALLGGTAVCVAYAAGRSLIYYRTFKVYAGQDERPKIAPSRQVIRETDNGGLKLTLYQFQTCPFCCKVRAMLDYHGFSYDVVEVNSVTKKQIKWLDYQKVPILVVEQNESKEEVVLKDSCVIISVLESYLHDRSTSLTKFSTYFPCLEEKEGRKTKYDFPNKYFIMYQEKSDLPSTPKQRNEERQWRKWTDSHLVHMLSPNVYRTVGESLQAFHHFSEVGDWENNFSYFERLTIIYLGAAVMYIMGFILKRRYELKDDVRLSLYDSCNEWVAAVGKNRPFMGGHEPNLADLAVYGVLNSIEGCPAFDDMLSNTNIGPWYRGMQKAVRDNLGSHPLNYKSTPSNIPKSLKNK